jgi:hypothetical protein
LARATIPRCSKQKDSLRCMLAAGHEPYGDCVFREGVD